MTEKPKAPVREYTEAELCETVFYLARYAECLELDHAVTVPDEHELMWMVLEWAREFETSFDPGGGKDHMSELEAQGTKWLLETFPYTPELDENLHSVGTSMLLPGM